MTTPSNDPMDGRQQITEPTIIVAPQTRQRTHQQQQQRIDVEMNQIEELNASENEIQIRSSPREQHEDETFDDHATGMSSHQPEPKQMLFISDAAMAPKQFTDTQDSQHVKTWLKYFENYAEYRQLLAEEKKRLFKLLLVDKAAEWIESQDETTTNNYETLISAFKLRFAPTEIQRWQTAGQIWSREQKINESVDEYTTAVINCAKAIPVTDTTMIKYAIIKGLRPEIRIHVLQSGSTTLEEVLKAARNSEAAREASGGVNNSQLDHLSAQMEMLVQKLNAQQISTIRSTSRSPERKVRFEETPAQPNYNRRQRSPTTHSMQERDETYERQPPYQQPISYGQQQNWQQLNYDNRTPTSASVGQQNASQQWRQPNQQQNFDNRTPTSTFGGPQNGQQQWRQPYNQPTAYSGQQRYPGRQFNCSNCNKTHDFNQCKAQGQRCFKCAKFNHFQSACRSSHFQQQRPSRYNRPTYPSPPQNQRETQYQPEQRAIQNIRQYQGQSNNIFARIGHNTVRLLIDSGAEKCCMSETLSRRLKLTLKKPNVNTPNLMAANGHSLKIIGECETTLTINGYNFDQNFIVIANLAQSGLIGHDFLEKYRGCISIANKILTLMDGLVVTDLVQKDAKMYVLKVEQNVRIPAHTEAKISVMTDRNYKSQLSLIENNRKHVNSISIARSLVRPRNQFTVCQIANFSDKTIRLRKGYKIASITPIDENDIENQRLLETKYEDDLITDSKKVQEITHEDKVTKLQNLGISFEKTELGIDDFEKLISVVYEYRELFDTSVEILPASTLPKMTINLTDEKPFRTPQYRLSPAMQTEVNNQCQKLLKAQIIRPSTSPYNSPVIIIKKISPDTGTSQYRMCIDMRRINKITVPEFACLESLASFKDRIAELAPTIFTTLDNRSAYHSIELDEKSKKLTAFSTNNARYEYNRCVFGARNSGSHFSRAVIDLLQTQTNKQILAYVDDLCLISKNFADHLKIITEVFAKYRTAKIRFNPTKAVFASKSVTWLGMEVSAEGVKISSKRFELIKTWKSPSNVKELRTFLGMANYFKSFIKGHSQLTWPLRKLLIANTPFVWETEQEQVFSKIKHILISDVTLEYANLDEELILETDASSGGLGYILKQRCPITNREKVIEYAGRSLRPYERNNSIYKLEILAIISGIQHFRMYLQSNREFLIRTDSISAKTIQSLPYGNGQSIRWSVFLDQFRFKIVHIEGKKNQVSDALSRREYTATEETQNDGEVIDPNAYVASITQIGPTDEFFADGEFANEKSVDKSKARHQRRRTHDLILSPITTGNSSQTAEAERCIELEAETNESQELIQTIDINNQSDDPFFNNIIQYLKNDKLPKDRKIARDILAQAEYYIIRNDKLFHMPMTRNKSQMKIKPMIYQLCLPRQHRMQVLKDYHDNLSHANGEKLYLTIRDKYYYRSLNKDCMDFAKTCNTCLLIKNAKMKACPIRSWPTATLFSEISIDHHGPINAKNATHDYKYILVIVDHFSENTRYVAAKTTSARETCELLVKEWFAHYGIPTKIRSDKSSSFLAQFTQELFKYCKIQHMTTAVYQPSSNGRVENRNSEFLKCIRALGKEKLAKWPEYLNLIEWSNRSQVSKSLNCTPFFAMYGQECQNVFDHNYAEDARTGIVDESFQWFDEKMTFVRNALKENLVAANERTEKYHNKKAQLRSFQIGDTVYRLNNKHTPGYTKSHLHLFEGPYVIVDMDKQDSLLVRLAGLYTGKVEKNQTHIGQLKRTRQRTNLEDKYQTAQMNPQTGRNTHVETDSENDTTPTPPELPNVGHVDQPSAIQQDQRTSQTGLQVETDPKSKNAHTRGTNGKLTHTLRSAKSGQDDQQMNGTGVQSNEQHSSDASQRYQQTIHQPNGTPKSQQHISTDANHSHGSDNRDTAVNHASLDDSAVNDTRADSMQQGNANGTPTHAHKQTEVRHAKKVESSTPADQGLVGNATKLDQRTEDNANRNDADQSRQQQVDRILQRRIFGRVHKYQVKFTDGSTLWLTPTEVDPIKLSEFNVRRYKQKQASKQRRFLGFNQ